MTFPTKEECERFKAWVLGMQKPGENFTKADVRFFYDLWQRTPRLREPA